MILVRNVFQAKYGRGDELVEVLVEGREMLSRYGMGSYRILTDLAGPFFTVIMEQEMESLAAHEQATEAYSDPDFGPWFARMTELVDSGSREFLTIEDR